MNANRMLRWCVHGLLGVFMWGALLVACGGQVAQEPTQETVAQEGTQEATIGQDAPEAGVPEATSEGSTGEPGLSDDQAIEPMVPGEPAPDAAVQEAAPEPSGGEQARPDDGPKDAGAEPVGVDGGAEPTSEAVPEVGPLDLNSPQQLLVSHANDVVTSYLLSGSAWNYFSGGTVRLGRHSNTGNTSYFTAFRFRRVGIPKNATITSATLSFYPHNEVDSSHRLMINIYAEKAGSSAAYDPTNYTSGRPDQRLKTTAKIDRWIVRCRSDCSSDATSPKYEYDCPQRKKDCWNRQTAYAVPKDLKTILQEVVSQPSWQAGNALSIFLFNAATDQDGRNYRDSRTLIGYDSTQKNKAPRLVVEFKP